MITLVEHVKIHMPCASGFPSMTPVTSQQPSPVRVSDKETDTTIAQFVGAEGGLKLMQISKPLLELFLEA